MDGQPEYTVKRLTPKTLTPERLARLVTLFRTLDDAENGYDATYGLRLRKPSDNGIRKWLLHRKDGIYAASGKDGKILGFSVSNPAQDYDRANYISTLSVDPAFRGRGIGRAVLEKIVRDNRSKKRRSLLHVSLNNPAGLHLYGSMGFKPIGQTMLLDEWQEKRAQVLSFPFLWAPKTPVQRTNPAMRRRNDYRFVRESINKYSPDSMPITPDGMRAFKDTYATPKKGGGLISDMNLAIARFPRFRDMFSGRTKNFDSSGIGDYYYELLTNPNFNSRLKNLGLTVDDAARVIRGTPVSFYKIAPGDSFAGLYTHYTGIPNNAFVSDASKTTTPIHELGHSLYNSMPRYAKRIQDLEKKHGIGYESKYLSSGYTDEGYYHSPKEQAAQLQAIRALYPEYMPGKGSGPRGDFIPSDLRKLDVLGRLRAGSLKSRITTYQSIIGKSPEDAERAVARETLGRILPSTKFTIAAEDRRPRLKFYDGKTDEPAGPYDIIKYNKNVSEKQVEGFIERWRNELDALEKGRGHPDYYSNPFESDRYFKGLPQGYILDLLNQVRSRPNPTLSSVVGQKKLASRE